MSNKVIRKYSSCLIAVILCAVLVFFCTPAIKANGASGSCGDNLTWSLDAGTLTITGSGAMTDFTESTMAPWYAYRDEILRIELPDGLTNIGAVAFYNCENLTAVVIPDSVTSIGGFSFANCDKLQMLTIGSGVKTIHESAFSDCYSIAALELPDGLTRIGNKGFYRCESLTTVTVPSSVTSMGVSAFAYCTNLVSVTVEASIRILPEYTFYGCERLSSVVLPDTTEEISTFSFRGCDHLDTVYYGGSGKSLEDLEDSILDEVPDFDAMGVVTDQQPSDAVTSGSIQQNQDGTITEEKITVTTGQNSSVSTKIEDTYQTDGAKIDSSADITVTVNSSDGWEEVKNVISAELENTETATEKIHINVFVKGTEEINPGFVEFFAGKPLDITITTRDGSSWKVDTSLIEPKKTSGQYDFRYVLSAGSQELCDELGTTTSFNLTFINSAQIDSEVLIYLGNTFATQSATLFQRTGKGLERVQSVVVDTNGYAHFYLASVDEDTEYCIGINIILPEDADAPIVPETIQSRYNEIENYQTIRYEITGRSSSWGMNLGQVMGILAAVMVSVIVIVGVVIYIWNKKRLKSGYIPGWDYADDEDDED